MGFFYLHKACMVEQIEAIAQLDYCTHNVWITNSPVRYFAADLGLARKLQTALGAGLPKIDSVAKPVVIVDARS